MLLFTAAAQAVEQDGHAGAQQEREYAHQDITVGSALTQHPGGAGGGNMQRDRCACPAGHGKAQADHQRQTGRHTARINDLKQQKKDEKITEEQFKEQAAEIKKDKNAPTVVIKGTDESSYKNLIDALDEMQICNISRYAIVDITDGDKFLLDNYEQKGELTRNIDR